LPADFEVDGLVMVFEVDGLTGALDFLVEEGAVVVVVPLLKEGAIIAVDVLLEEGADVGASVVEEVVEDVEPAVDAFAFALAALFSAMMAWILACSIALVDLRLLLLFSIVSFCVRVQIWVYKRWLQPR